MLFHLCTGFFLLTAEAQRAQSKTAERKELQQRHTEFINQIASLTVKELEAKLLALTPKNQAIII